MIAEKQKAVFAGKNYEYTSREISTFPVFRQTYGYFEAKVKYEAMQGLWPAFWLKPDDEASGNKSEMREAYLHFEILDFFNFHVAFIKNIM